VLGDKQGAAPVKSRTSVEPGHKIVNVRIRHHVINTMTFLSADLRLAAQGLRKTPAFVFVAVLSLALGIGANVTVFSVVREMILDDFSAKNPERLARIDGAYVTPLLYRELRSTGTFQDLAFHNGLGNRIWNTGGRSEIVWTFPTSANFFDVLGVRAFAGRLYSQSDEGRELAAVSHGFWRRRPGGNRNIIGTAIELNGKLHTIVGVLPPDYRSIYGHGVSPEVYLLDALTQSQARLYGLFGRLSDGVSLQQTRQSFVAVYERLKGPEESRHIVELHPMGGLRAHAWKSGDERLFFLFFVLLFGVAGSLMLICCSNVAALLIGRNLNRRRELAIRKALGASRSQLVRPLLAEAVVLVACGAGAGLAFDALVRNQLRHLRWPTAYGLPFEFHFQNDSGLFAYAGLTAIVALLLAAFVPALRSAETDINLAVKQGQPSFSLRRRSLRTGFVALQVVMSALLLALCGLFTNSLLHLRAGPGFDVNHTLIAAPHSLPHQRSPERSWDFRQRVVRRVETVAGVVAVTSAGILPLMGEIPEAILRRDTEPVSAPHHAYVVGAGEQYCTTLGIPILSGRDFELADRARKPIPIVINQALAREFFPDTEPIGQSLLMGQEPEQRLEVVGLMAHTKMRTLGEGKRSMFLKPDFNAQLLVRVAGDPNQWIEPLRSALAEVDQSAALDVRPLEEAVAGPLFPMRVATGFLGALGLLGLALTLIGLYGSISDAVRHRTRELGIRAALGASPRRIVWTALEDGMAVLAAGTMVGDGVGVLVIRDLVDLLPAEVNPWAAGPFLAVAFLLLSAGALASWVPARRAARIDPLAALRQE
jgi:putative ABC transport system permease protein